jgi:hypothetical protein
MHIVGESSYPGGHVWRFIEDDSSCSVVKIYQGTETVLFDGDHAGAAAYWATLNDDMLDPDFKP